MLRRRQRPFRLALSGIASLLILGLSLSSVPASAQEPSPPPTPGDPPLLFAPPFPPVYHVKIGGVRLNSDRRLLGHGVGWASSLGLLVPEAMKDRLLWGPIVGWGVILIGILGTASVLLGRLPKDVKERLRPGASTLPVRVWLGGLGLGSIVWGAGVVRQDALFTFLAGLAWFFWGIVGRALVSPWLRSRWDRDEQS